MKTTWRILYFELPNEKGSLMDKVLIVDDNADVLESLSEGLGIYNSQFEVLTARDGSDAIKLLGQHSISLLVTDLMMPGVGGLQLIAYLTKNFPATPIIVMTGYGTADIRDNLIQEEVLRYIEKPFHLKELASAIIEGLDMLDEGASLKGVAVSSFLPLIEMEQVTCLLQIKSPAEGSGLFYFEKGVIFDASCNKLKPELAAIKMLGWEKVEINFLSLPKKTLEQRIFSDLMSLISEARRRKENTNAANEKESPGEQDQLVPEIDLDRQPDDVRQPETMGTEVIIQEDPDSEIEQDVFLEILPGRETVVDEKLNKFKDMKGFLSIGVFSSGGEMIASVCNTKIRLDKIGDFVFEIIRKARKSLKIAGLGDCDVIDIRATGGEHFLVRSYTQGEIEFVVVLICSSQAELGLFKHRLGLVAPTLAEELKIR
jgi:CheY-like chemotaxis protein